jgi:HD-GYP domain-containing protein (c-di-GMP phosphodiesterase class II)
MKTATLYRTTNDTENSPASMMAHLRAVHSLVSSRYPDVDRIALATYNPEDGMLRTLVGSNQDGMPLVHYAAPLASIPSLAELTRTRRSSVVDDIQLSGNTAHTDWLMAHGHRSTLGIPIFQEDQLSAILFFDSKKPAAFDRDAVEYLELFAKIVLQAYFQQLHLMRGIATSVEMASNLARLRDLETGKHLDRTGAYSALIARAVAPHYGLNDEFIEYVCQFARLHDIGKVGIPDRILLKPGKLDPDEWVVIRTHVTIGEAILEKVEDSVTMGNPLARQIMRNIVSGHHERGDGSGYPRGLTMDQIPVEARIVAVADVYDALSNRRPYKKPWTEEAIMVELRNEVSNGRLDGVCVEALLAQRSQRDAILEKFEELTDPV